MRALVLLLGAVLYAQAPSFRSGVELVRIPVNLTQGDRPVEPGVVTADDFKVTEGGVVQPVTIFERDSRPISLCVVFDTSGSMGEGLLPHYAVTSLRQMLTRLLPDDEVAIVAFAKVTELITPWTPAPQLAGLGIKLETRGNTSLNDGVARAMDLLEDARHDRPVILLITDGFENASRTTVADIVKTRRQSEAQIYAFNLGPALISLRGMHGDHRQPSRAGITGQTPTTSPAMSMPSIALPPVDEVLTRLVGDSGGVSYPIRDERDTAAVARAFVDDLRFQYTIGYAPVKALDGKYRRVKVEMKKRGFRIRHRGGYLALPATPP